RQNGIDQQQVRPSERPGRPDRRHYPVRQRHNEEDEDTVVEQTDGGRVRRAADDLHLDLPVGIRRKEQDPDEHALPGERSRRSERGLTRRARAVWRCGIRRNLGVAGGPGGERHDRWSWYRGWLVKQPWRCLPLSSRTARLNSCIRQLQR